MVNILVIDDDEPFRQYLAIFLARSGFRVHTLPNGSGLFNAMESAGIDAIITDLFMPETDGIETVLAVRQRFPRVPVIGMTGGRFDAVDNPCVAAMIRFGAAAVLRKPIDERELLALLQRLLAREPCLPPAPTTG